jgi:hypothetical protein
MKDQTREKKDSGSLTSNPCEEDCKQYSPTSSQHGLCDSQTETHYTLLTTTAEILFPAIGLMLITASSNRNGSIPVKECPKLNSSLEKPPESSREFGAVLPPPSCEDRWEVCKLMSN